MRGLTEIYNSKYDVRDSEIPREFYRSFQEFMFGQTCYKDDSSGEDEFMYFLSDLKMWYRANIDMILLYEKSQERDNKINKLLE